MTSPLHRTPRAFTLTEILVAVSIIGVLASIILSTASQVQSGGYRVKCASNLRQIGVAMQAYCAEHDGQLPGPLRSGQPAVYHRDGYGPTDNFLATFLAPYLSLPTAASGTSPVANVFVCPAWAAWSRNFAPKETIRLYLVCAGARLTDGTLRPPFGYPGDAVSPNPVKSFLIDSPSKTAAMYDLDQQNATQYAGDPNVPKKPIHNGKRNFLFFDGHVETLSQTPPTL